jgi:hypothetical protein
VRRFGGGLLILVAALGAAFGGLWAFAKAGGGEVDICPAGRDCISGWYFAGPILVGAVVVGLIGVALLRRPR